MSSGKLLEDGPHLAGLYVYLTESNTVPSYEDLYKRNLSQLLASFALVGQKLLTEDSFPLALFTKKDISSVVRICQNQARPEDIKLLMFSPITARTKSSIILHIAAHDTTLEAMNVTKFVPSYEQIVIIHNFAPSKWITLLVLLKDNSTGDKSRNVECFFNELSDRDPIETFLVQLSLKLSEIFPNLTFRFQERIAIPNDFEADPAILAFVLAVTLHRRGQYLSISDKWIMQYKFQALLTFLPVHDRWLAKFDLRRAKDLKYPFIYDQEYKELLPSNKVFEDNLDNLKTFGWKVLDVEGDGHCGYYSILLGLENIGKFNYTPRQHSSDPLKNLNMWRAKVIKLRQDLQKHSRKLISQKYLGKTFGELPDWWDFVGVDDPFTDKGKLSLSNEFVQAKWKTKNYFTNSLPDNLQFSVNWAPIVVASLFNVRVIIISRETKIVPKPDKTAVENGTSGNVNTATVGIDRTVEDTVDVVMEGSTLQLADMMEDQSNGTANANVAATVGIDRTDGAHWVDTVNMGIDGSKLANTMDETTDGSPLADTVEETTDTSKLAGTVDVESTPYGWCTHTVEVINPFDSDEPHIKRQFSEGIHCMSVEELKKKPTIEMLHTWGFPDTGVVPHYQFLFRILHDNIPYPSVEHKPSLAAILSQKNIRDNPIRKKTPSEERAISKIMDECNRIELANMKKRKGQKPKTAVQPEEKVTKVEKKKKGKKPSHTMVEAKKKGKKPSHTMMETKEKGTAAAVQPEETPAKMSTKSKDEAQVQQKKKRKKQALKEAEEAVEELTAASVTTELEVPTAKVDTHSNNVVKEAVVTAADSEDGTEPTRSQKARRVEELGKMFDSLYYKESLKHANVRKGNANQMMYDPIKRTYFIRYYDYDSQKFTPREPAGQLSKFDKKLVRHAKEFEGAWIGNTPGAPGDHDNPPPKHLVTKIKGLPQGNNPYCFTYSLASALLYCGFPLAGKLLPGQAIIFSEHCFDRAVEQLVGLMVNIAPTIARPTIFGKRTRRGFVRSLSWNDVFSKLTPYPTLIIPVLPDGSSPHAICVVDDLIFDSITTNALKLCEDSLNWIFNDSETKINFALRFETKESPKGMKVEGKYERPIKVH
jgi:hypothetical protein